MEVKKMETIMTFFDNDKNRKKTTFLNKIEVMADDGDNNNDKFWNDLEDFIEWGKTYKMTIEEV
jgi:hypothetical protein